MNTRNTKRNANIIIITPKVTKPKDNKKQQQLAEELPQEVNEISIDSEKQVFITTNELDINSETIVKSFDNLNNDWSEEKDPKDGKSVFFCKWKFCSFRTWNESSIRNHTNRHQMPYKCSFVGCGQRYADPKDLKTHFSETHLDSKAFKCTFAECGERFTDIKALTEHRVSHVSKGRVSDKSNDNYENETNEDIEENETQVIECPTNSQINTIYITNVTLDESVNKQNRGSLRLSDVLDRNITQTVVTNESDYETTIESQDKSMTQLTTTIELGEPMIQFEIQAIDENQIEAEPKYRKKLMHSVIRVANDQIRDEIIEGNDNYIKLRTLEGRFWYKCLWDYCDYGNLNEGLIRRHVQKHEFPHKCSFEGCNKSFATVLEMGKHRVGVHSGDNPYKCDYPECEEAFDSLANLAQHKRQHLPKPVVPEPKARKVRESNAQLKPFQCNFGKCCMNYATEEELEIHKQIHSGFRPFKCLYPDCTFAAKTKDKLKNHHLRHSRNRNYKCFWPTCDKSFTISEQLRRHKKLHINRKDMMCEFADCDLEFENVVDLETHLREHLGLPEKDHSFDEFGFKCRFGFCKQQFQSEEELQKHSETHCGQRLYKCGYQGCTYSGKTLEKLTSHIRYHSGERPYKCDFIGCHQDFIQSHHLARHRRSHFGNQDMDIKPSIANDSDETSFNCEFQECSETFDNKESLDSHYVNIHKKRVRRPVNKNNKKIKTEATEADSGADCTANEFNVDSNLNIVKKKRKRPIKEAAKKFSCSFGKCNYKSATDRDLKAHMKLHSGDRPFVCYFDDCTYKTNRRDSLNAHMRRHTGEKPYECEWTDCGECFKSRVQLKRHHLYHFKSKQTLEELEELDKEIDRTLEHLDSTLEESCID